MKLQLVLSILLVFIFTACNSGLEEEAQSLQDVTTNTLTDNGPRPTGLGILSGTLKVKDGDKNKPAPGAQIKFDDFPQYNTTANSDGYYRSSAPPGTYNIVMDYTAPDGTKYGFAIPNYPILPFQANVLDGLLEEMGSISGSVGLAGIDDPSLLVGAPVTLHPGGYTTTVGMDGTYSLDGIPPGTYTAVIGDINYIPVETAEFTVLPEIDTSLPDYDVGLNPAPTGNILGAEGFKNRDINGFLHINTVTPTLNIEYTSSAFEMKISNEANFLAGTDWMPVSATYILTGNILSANKEQSLFIKFKDAAGQESNASAFKINVDMAPPIIQRHCLFYCFSQVSTSAAQSLPVLAHVVDYYGLVFGFQIGGSEAELNTAELQLLPNVQPQLNAPGGSFTLTNIVDDFNASLSNSSALRVFDLAGNFSTISTSQEVSIGERSIFSEADSLILNYIPNFDVSFDSHHSPITIEKDFFQGSHSKKYDVEVAYGLGATLKEFKKVPTSDLENITESYFSKNGVHYVGTHGGLYIGKPDVDEENPTEFLIQNGRIGTYVAKLRTYEIIDTTNGLLDPKINAFYVDDRTENEVIYIATDRGLVVKDGDNLTYFNDKNGLPSNIVNDVYLSNNTLMLGTDKGMAISDDGGATFSIHSADVGNFGVNYITNFTLYTSTDEVRIYVSSSSGLHMLRFFMTGDITYEVKTKFNGLGSDYVNSVSVYEDIVYVATNDGLSISFDGGNSFLNKTIATGLGSNMISNVQVAKDKIFASTSNGLSISNDKYGNVFQNYVQEFRTADNQVSAPYGTVNNVFIDHNDVTYISTNMALLYSGNYGETYDLLFIKTPEQIDFELMSQTSSTFNRINEIEIVNDRYHVLTDTGYFVSNDKGVSFQKVDLVAKGIPDDDPTGIKYINDRLYLYEEYSGYLMYSDDNGETFTSVTLGAGSYEARVVDVEIYNDKMYIGTKGGLAIEQDDGSLVYKKEEDGLADDYYINDIEIEPSGRIHVSTYYGISSSSDNGETYTSVRLTDRDDYNTEAYHVKYHDGVLYYATRYGLQTSADGGVTFNHVDMFQEVFKTDGERYYYTTEPWLEEIVITPDNQIMVLGWDGVFFQNQEDGSFDYVQINKEYMTSNDTAQVYDVAFGEDNKMYFTNRWHGLISNNGKIDFRIVE